MSLNYDDGYQTIKGVTQDAWNNFQGASVPAAGGATPQERFVYAAARLAAFAAVIRSTARLPNEMFASPQSQMGRGSTPMKAFSRWALTMIVAVCCYDLEATLNGISEALTTEQ